MVVLSRLGKRGLSSRSLTLVTPSPQLQPRNLWNCSVYMAAEGGGGGGGESHKKKKYFIRELRYMMHGFGDTTMATV